MSEKKLFEAGGVEYGVAGDTEATVSNMKGVNPDLLRADGEPMVQPKSAPVSIQKPEPTPPPAPKPKAPTPKAPEPKAPEPKGDPSGGLPAIPWKQIAIVAGAAGLLAALIALLRKCTKSIKLRFNKSVRTLARMQKDFTLSKGGLDMRAVLPGVGSRLNDFLTRAFSGSAFMNNGKTGVMDNTKSGRKFKDGVIGLYPFCDIYKEELRNDLAMAQTTFTKIKIAADTAGKDATTESYNGKVYQSFTEAFASDRLNENKNGGQVNESIMTLAALAPMVIRGGAFIVNKIKNGKADPKEAKTVQVTKQSTREICYAILNNFFEKYISFEDVSKKMGVDIKGLSDVDESSIDKLGKVIKAYSNPDGGSVVKQYARVKKAYDGMLTHYLNIGNGIIKNFEKYTKADDEKHENLLVASKEKLQAMWDQQKDQYEHLFPYVMMEIINDGAYAAYIDFITESVLPVFKTGIAGDADYVLDVMPKKGQYFLLSQTAQNGNIGNKAVCKITEDYSKDTKTVGIKILALYKGNFTITPEGNYELETDADKFDMKAYGAMAPQDLEFNKFMSLDPHQITNMEEVLKKDMKLDPESFIDKEIIVTDKGLDTFKAELANNYNANNVTAMVYKLTKLEGDKAFYIIEYVSNNEDIKNKLRFDKEKNIYEANAEDFAAIPEDKRKENSFNYNLIDENHRPITFNGDIKNLDSNTKIEFTVEEKGKKITYEGFVGQGKENQEIILKGTLSASDEEKAKNDENGKSSFMKIARVNISKDAKGEDIVKYFTDTYEAKFEKQENDDFAKQLAAEAKDNNNLETKSFTDITEPNQVGGVVSAITKELIDSYERQTNSRDGGATDVNPLTRAAWIGKSDGNTITITSIFKDRQSKDENPEIIGLAACADNGKKQVYGKIAIAGDFNSIKERVDKLVPEYVKYEDNIENPETIANIGSVKDENVQIKKEWKQDEDFKKFLTELVVNLTGFEKDEKKISAYITEVLNKISDTLTITIQQPENKDASAAQSQSMQQPNGNAKNPSGTPAAPTNNASTGNAENSEQNIKNSGNFLNEKEAGYIDPEEALKILNVTIAIKLEQLEDGTALKVLNGNSNISNILTIEFAKLLYKTSDEKYKKLTAILEFCDGRTGEKSGQYALVSTIAGSDGNPIKNDKVMKGMNVLGTNDLPSTQITGCILTECKAANIDIVMGEMPKQEESLNERKAKVQESIKFTATYSINDKIIESAAFNTGINRKIVADKDCSKYYVLSECMWSMANDTAVKKALVNKVKSTLKTYSTKEGLMEYAKANQNVEMSRNFSDMSYVVKNPGNLHSIIGCSLYECAVAVKFNDNNRISNAIAIGVNKIK